MKISFTLNQLTICFFYKIKWFLKGDTNIKFNLVTVIIKNNSNQLFCIIFYKIVSNEYNSDFWQIKPYVWHKFMYKLKNNSILTFQNITMKYYNFNSIFDPPYKNQYFLKLFQFLVSIVNNDIFLSAINIIMTNYIKNRH